MYDLVWSCLVTMLMYFLVRSQMVLFGRVWSCMALRSYAQFLCLLGLQHYSYFPENLIYIIFDDISDSLIFRYETLPVSINIRV